MRIWKTTDGLERVPDKVRVIHDLINASFMSRGERMPRMLGVSTCETDADEHVYEIYVELAPGVVLRTCHGSFEDVVDDDEFPIWIAPSAAQDAEAWIVSHLGAGPERLSDLLHDLRIRARRILSARAMDGGYGRLVDVQLTADGYTSPFEIMVRITLEGLDAQLRRMIDHVRIDDLDMFDARIDEWSATMSRRYAARRSFDAVGASGSIDMLTLAAAATFADAPAWLRSLASTRWPDSLLDATVFADDGAFRSHGCDVASGLSWNRDTVQVPGALPVTTLAVCAGRPVTDLIDHPMLSDEMRIIGATNEVDGTTAHVSVRITQPRLLFCTASGRTWRGGA